MEMTLRVPHLVRAGLAIAETAHKLAAIPNVVIQARLNLRPPALAPVIRAENTVTVELGILEVQVGLPGVGVYV